MFELSRRARLLVGGAIGLNILVGAAAVAGVVPRPAETVTIAAVSGAEATLDPATDEFAASAADVAEEVPETTIPTTVPATTATTKAPRTTTTKATTPPTTAAPVATAATSPVAATAAESTATTLPPRRNPSSAEVQAAMQHLRQRIGGLLAPSEAQARQFGDMVCDAFDQGKSSAEVKATAMQEVAKIPLVTVTSATADFALKTAVQLFCPGHATKLP